MKKLLPVVIPLVVSIACLYGFELLQPTRILVTKEEMGRRFERDKSSINECVNYLRKETDCSVINGQEYCDDGMTPQDRVNACKGLNKHTGETFGPIYDDEWRLLRHTLLLFGIFAGIGALVELKNLFKRDSQ